MTATSGNMVGLLGETVRTLGGVSETPGDMARTLGGASETQGEVARTSGGMPFPPEVAGFSPEFLWRAKEIFG